MTCDWRQLTQLLAGCYYPMSSNQISSTADWVSPALGVTGNLLYYDRLFDQFKHFRCSLRNLKGLRKKRTYTLIYRVNLFDYMQAYARVNRRRFFTWQKYCVIQKSFVTSTIQTRPTHHKRVQHSEPQLSFLCKITDQKLGGSFASWICTRFERIRSFELYKTNAEKVYSVLL